MTAAGGISHRTPSQPSACQYWLGRWESTCTPPHSPFLTASALQAKRKLEEEEKEKAKAKKLKKEMEAAEHEEKTLELNRRFQPDLPLSAAERVALRRWMRTDPVSFSSSAGTRRKKKRRKRKTPKTSSFRAARTRKFYVLFRSGRMERLLWRCHEFGGVWVFDSSWYALASAAQRQFCIGLCLQLVLCGEGGCIYTDMVENTRGAVNAGWVCWLRCTSCCISFDYNITHALRHHGGYGPEGQFLRA